MLSRYFESRNIPLLKFPGGPSTPLRFSEPRDEHLATRRAAGLFDFSFMGCFEIRGAQALRYLNCLQTRNLSLLKPGTLCYTLLCGEDGCVFNDATVWRHGLEHYWLFTGRRSDIRHLADVARLFEVELTDCSGRYAVIALQGPESLAILRRCCPAGDLEGLAYFGFQQIKIHRQPGWIGRLGYSGEKGYELIVPVDAAVGTWKQLHAEGVPEGLMECGFSAADSLRIEAGYVLFSNELRCRVTPFEIGLERLVSLNRSDFVGCRALQTMRWKPIKRRLTGLVPDRSGDSEFQFLKTMTTSVRSEDWIRPGVACLTSVCVSPVFRRVLGMGFVDEADRYPGSRVVLDGKVRAEIARLPFYDPAKVLPRS